MKTRIISGIVMGIIVAAVLAAGFFISPIIITFAVAALAAGAVYELLYNAVKIKDKICIVSACVYTAAGVVLAAGGSEYYKIFGRTDLTVKLFENFSDLVYILTALYLFVSALLVLKNHAAFSLADITAFCGMPALLIFVFSSLDFVINAKNSVYYLLLLLNFACVCDMGAYFTGVTLGKHKLCPAISPKKTVEGALGGIISSMIVTVIISLCFSKSLLLPIVFTIPLCILGMLGDLFASAIKRSVELKDYSNLIPGHGGILDRFDSIIMIAPLLTLFIKFGVL